MANHVQPRSCYTSQRRWTHLPRWCVPQLEQFLHGRKRVMNLIFSSTNTKEASGDHFHAHQASKRGQSLQWEAMHNQTCVALSCFRRRGDIEANLVHNMHHFSNPESKTLAETLSSENRFESSNAQGTMKELMHASPHCRVLEWLIEAMGRWGVEKEKGSCEFRVPSQPGQADPELPLQPSR